MSDSNVDLESNGNKETSFDCWSESTDKVFTSSGDGVQDVFCPSENPKMHQTDDSSRCFGFHGCSFRCQWYQHRQVCNLRLPLLPQLEMECFLCHILWWYWSILKTSHLNYFLFVKKNAAAIVIPSGKKSTILKWFLRCIFCCSTLCSWISCPLSATKSDQF